MIVAIFALMAKMIQSAGGSQAMTFGKSKAKMLNSETNKIKNILFKNFLMILFYLILIIIQKC